MKAWKDSRTPVLSAWVSLGEGNFKEAVDALGNQEGTLAAYVRGMALFSLNQEGSLASLEQVLVAWSDVPEPMTQILVGRARAAKALLSQPLFEVEAKIREIAPTDPVVFVMLARAMDGTGQRASAERLYLEAVAKGPQSAMAQHALGLFWFDPQGDLSGAREVWRRYLDLQPNGDRARRARARMGRR